MLTLFILSYTLGAVVTYVASFAYWQQILPGDIAKRHYWSYMQIAIKDSFLWPFAVYYYYTIHERVPFKCGLKFY